MAPQQKEAWFVLAVSAMSVFAFLALLAFFPWQLAFAGFSLLGIAGLSPLFFLLKGGKPVILDERDKDIRFRATAGAYGLFWVVFVAFSVGLGIATHWTGEVPVIVLTQMVVGGLGVVVVTRAVAMLALYGKGASREGA